ncbi:hypothetical protein LCGC14_2926270 [marine sediment metagenome]|uniref:Uncharacterized protein n=1 Tax=marine sediment metagenome TaxID=412755 RepID=A0A0F8Y922_9ZZZZ
MELAEVWIRVREKEAEEFANALRVLFERAWPEVVVYVAKVK